MDAAARHRSERLRGYAAGALGILALAVSIVAGGGPAVWESAGPPRVYTEQHAVGWRSGDFRGAQLPGGNADTSSWWKQQDRFDSDPQPTYFGESGRNSNLLTADAQNFQTAALAQLDGRDHPGVTVPMESLVVAAATGRVREMGGTLTEAEMRAVLTEAGWPAEWHDDALAIAWCESRWSPYAVGDGGNSRGLFQLNVATWFAYAGEGPEMWADPLTNARVAWAVMGYDAGRGYERWRQWSCKPGIE